MTNKTNRVKTMTIAALLCAIGIIIPMFSPIRIMIEPASFTLASHVAIMIAMFISPSVAIMVALGTSFGFFVAGFPIVIVLRALTHVIFATFGALLLKKNQNTLLSIKSASLFAIVISVIHAVAEVAIVSFFYWGNPEATPNNFLVTVIGLVGIGTFIHSIVDFLISLAVWKPLQFAVHIPANAKVKVRG